MLRASHRLSVRQFEEVFEKGRVAHSPFFTLRFVIAAPTASSRGPAKIAAVATQKSAKTATRRAYLRRKGYEMIGTFYPRIKKGTRAIIFMKSTAADASKEPSFADQADELQKMFDKAGLLL